MNKKGFTIVETVVAIVVIALISLTATTLVLMNNQTSKNTRDKFLAINLCDNYIAVFQSAAKDSRDIDNLIEVFSYRLNECLDTTLPDLIDDHTTIYLDKDFNQTNSKDNAKVICVFSFKEKADMVTLEISVNLGKINYSTSYKTLLSEA